MPFAHRMICAMKNLITAVCVPLFAFVTAATAQEGETQKPPAKQEKPAKQEPQKDDKATAADPAIQAIDKFIKAQSVDTKKDGWRTGLKEPPKQTFAADADYFWHVQTSAGTVKIRYLTADAPVHVTSGIYLARLGFYDGLGFHRIIPNFMAQGGCPNTADPKLQRAWGTGGPGYYIDGEFASGRKHDKPGLLSMANTGRPMTDGSQFFLTFVPTPWLDGKHTVWGEVVDGMETVKALEKLGSSANNGMLAKPVAIVRTWITVEPKAKAGDAKQDGDGKDAGKKGGEKGGEKGE